MNILFNFIPIKSGGGQQVATNFVNVFLELEGYSNSVFLVTENTHIDHILSKQHKFQVVKVKDGLKSRFVFEQFQYRNLLKQAQIDVIFTMFGPNLPKTRVTSIVGCAYSNIFYPEVNFWKGYSFLQRLKHKWIDHFRLKRTLSADGVIFENEEMKRRAIRFFRYPENRTTFIRPSISKSSIQKTANKRFVHSKGYKILYLTGWHKNKNIGQIPFILKELKKIGINDVNFCISVSKEHPSSKDFINQAQELGVKENIELLGSIEPEYVSALFDEIDAVILLSRLESFSNNVIESWSYKKPFIISDFDWSRSICNNAALFVNVDAPKQIAEKITLLKEDKAVRDELVNNGIEELKKYPSPTEKVLQQLQFIKRIHDI